MQFRWHSKGHYDEVVIMSNIPAGNNVRGLIREGERPNDVVLDYQDLRTMLFGRSEKEIVSYLRDIMHTLKLK